MEGYEKKQLLEKLSSKCYLFKAIKQGKEYLMYEYTSMDMSDEYNYKILSKLITCPFVLGVIERFQLDNSTYVVTNYVESNLLRQQLKLPHQIFPVQKALQVFALIVKLIEEIHENSIIYRNLRLETIRYQDNQVFLSDFSFSQMVKRRQRYFEPVGVAYYLAPQFYSEDGYGYEVDIWAAGVCLFHMLTGTFPFDIKQKGEDQILGEIKRKCNNGFNFNANAAQTKKAKYIESNQLLEDLFTKIFETDFSIRITIPQLKAHPAIKKHFQSPYLFVEGSMMSVIQQETSISAEKSTSSSVFLSMLSGFSVHRQFHKQQVILEFMEHSSQILVLTCSQKISEELKALVSFSILKVALSKVNQLVNVLFETREPQFKIDRQQWEIMKKTTGFVKAKQKIQKKKKIIEMLFRAAFLNVQNFKPKSGFYSEQVAEDFSLLKQQKFGYLVNIEKTYLKCLKFKRRL